MTEGAIRLNDEHWPLVVVVYEGSPSKTVFDRYLGEMERCFSRREKHGYLLDGRDGAMLGPEQRTAQGVWLKKHSDVLRAYSVGTGLVVRSAAVRFLLTAIYLIQEPVAPTETFNSVDQAYAWLAQTFERHALKMPKRSDLAL